MRDMVRAGEFVAQYKELVFDIDMTDYDDVRMCCSGADICLRLVDLSPNLCVGCTNSGRSLLSSY